MLPVEESITKTEREEVTNQATIKGILVTIQGIDEIRAELGEERQSALLESDYWDVYCFVITPLLIFANQSLVNSYQLSEKLEKTIVN